LPDLLHRHDRVDPAPERDKGPRAPRRGAEGVWGERLPPRIGGGLGGSVPPEANTAQVEVVAVGEFGQALEVELAEEGFLGSGQRGLAEVDDRGRGRLVVRE